MQQWALWVNYVRDTHQAFMVVILLHDEPYNVIVLQQRRGVMVWTSTPYVLQY